MSTGTESLLDQHIVLDHGTGARLSRELVEFVVGVLGDVYIGEMEDSAVLPISVGRIAMTTDSFVVDPPFFGNGDIGKIAVCGTVNDLAVVGAQPLYLTLAMILETGLPIAQLHRALVSIRDTAREAGVKIVAGDTKVVGEGEADGIFLNTTGIGVFHEEPKRMTDVEVGDRIILSGPIGNHTIHLLSVREGLGFEQRVVSDCAPLNGMIDSLRDKVPAGAVRSMRDVTRGGLSAVLHEYSSALGRAVRIEESALPIDHETRMAADMLGIDPINAANEGCLALFVAPDAVDAVLETLHAHEYGRRAVLIGEITERAEKAVEMVGTDGRISEIEELKGAELPRLC
ncbi:hydrogenase expression/formation protein HypE [Streptomyces dangxiongensis]|uniref:hydrogenase expression/formation protein HypE n=1 Tax=Streptomyces dangxiongensis TaxID=1442032 RepID=UPI001F09404B|nr:hydrogenase expression/formation protein HypE [Streptomyces dangxiongensis]